MIKTIQAQTLNEAIAQLKECQKSRRAVLLNVQSNCGKLDILGRRSGTIDHKRGLYRRLPLLQELPKEEV